MNETIGAHTSIVLESDRNLDLQRDILRNDRMCYREWHIELIIPH
jgi:hypothetical protein